MQKDFPNLPVPVFYSMDIRDFEEKQRKNFSRMHAIYDLSMGVLWAGVGIFFLFYRKLGFDFDFDPVLTSIFGGASILYGIFRFYRGYKKNTNR
ncbi:MAG: hypothetical protein SFU87_16350 [Chitinophagaceae bacterium]|nr:hypothetical protein [Chitinophagaceae bacterium]